VPAGSLLTLLDDIATVLDDVALLTKAAARKTSGVLGDDLALNAEQVAGVRAERELPVVWAVFLGSLKNKAILVPAALLVSALAPRLVLPLLMVGGLYLCFEGVEKVWHKLSRRSEEDAHRVTAALADPTVDLVRLEADKIAGAIRTDFILSAEIVVIALGIVAEKPLVVQIPVLIAIALAMAVGVYGLVAAIVRLDDVGRQLTLRYARGPLHLLGLGLLAAAPALMKLLAVAGTAAMFLVGGGILVHGIPWLHHAVEGVGHAWGSLAELGANAAVGMVAGTGCMLAWSVASRLRGVPAH
jgi:predicted DNA repair protein MutK